MLRYEKCYKFILNVHLDVLCIVSAVLYPKSLTLSGIHMSPSIECLRATTREGARSCESNRKDTLVSESAGQKTKFRNELFARAGVFVRFAARIAYRAVNTVGRGMRLLSFLNFVFLIMTGAL